MSLKLVLPDDEYIILLRKMMDGCKQKGFRIPGERRYSLGVFRESLFESSK